MDKQTWIRPLTADDRIYFPDEGWQMAASENAPLAFTLGKGEERWGWIAIYAIPGLTGIYDLDGFVQPDKRRRGVGSQLLHHLAKVMGGGQISYAIKEIDSIAARFFRANNFYVEHEEWMFVHDGTRQHPAAANNRTIRPAAAQTAAVHQFLQLYDDIFSSYRWYQPYRDFEVEFMLTDITKMLFLMQAGQPVGLAWLHLLFDVGEIEPIGILPAYQGRGNGRFLLQTAINHLYDRGAATVKIGVWRENETAVALYKSVGFHHHKTVTYYALDL